MRAHPDLSIVIPAYKEEARLGPTLRSYLDWCRDARRSVELTVVDDGSLDGTSQVVEQLTDEIEKRASEYIRKIDEMGGALRSIENGFMQNEIQEAAYQYQKSVEKGESTMVGVNAFQFDQPALYGLERLASKLRERHVCLYAPDDIQQVMPTGDRARIEAEAHRMLDLFGGRLIAKNYGDLHGIGVQAEWDDWAYQVFAQAAGGAYSSISPWPDSGTSRNIAGAPRSFK
jgi:hypothetical protein